MKSPSRSLQNLVAVHQPGPQPAESRVKAITRFIHHINSVPFTPNIRQG